MASVIGQALTLAGTQIECLRDAVRDWPHECLDRSVNDHCFEIYERGCDISAVHELGPCEWCKRPAHSPIHPYIIPVARRIDNFSHLQIGVTKEYYYCCLNCFYTKFADDAENPEYVRCRGMNLKIDPGVQAYGLTVGTTSATAMLDKSLCTITRCNRWIPRKTTVLTKRALQELEEPEPKKPTKE